jgi:hypothetical protein
MFVVKMVCNTPKHEEEIEQNMYSTYRVHLIGILKRHSIVPFSLRLYKEFQKRRMWFQFIFFFIFLRISVFKFPFLYLAFL